MTSSLVRHLRAYGQVVIDVAPALLVLLRPELAPAAVAFQGAKSYVQSHLTQLRKAWLTGVAETVQGVDQRVQQLEAPGEINLRTKLLEPDMVFLLGVARDQYAVAQFRSRLDRFARVLAGRVVYPASDFERDYLAALAALELSDDAVRVLEALRAWREQESVEYGSDKLDAEPSRYCRATSQYLLRAVGSPPATAARVDDLSVAIRTLERHGLVAEGDAMFEGVIQPLCADGSQGMMRDHAWILTPSGDAFLQRIRDIDASE